MKKLLIVIIACMLISLLGGVFWYLRNSGPWNPIETGTNTPNKSSTAIPPGMLKLTDGSNIPIPEFIVKNEATTTLSADAFRDIAGNDYSDYRITYLPYNKQNSQIEFAIILNALPLSKTRRDAENILRSRLGVGNQELCKMDINVYVFGAIAEEYAGQNLGLSFCENAVELP